MIINMIRYVDILSRFYQSTRYELSYYDCISFVEITDRITFAPANVFAFNCTGWAVTIISL